jgi:hypothetical protein
MSSAILSELQDIDFSPAAVKNVSEVSKPPHINPSEELPTPLPFPTPSPSPAPDTLDTELESKSRIIQVSQSPTETLSVVLPLCTVPLDSSVFPLV